MTEASQPMQPDPLKCEVFVIGGGPAGSTIAALLAERGRDVVVFGKDRHPRFHIGESLLPLNVLLFEKLGIKSKIERIGLLKYGAEFTSPQHGGIVTLEFSRAWDRNYTYAYQVRRSEFDQVLFEHCLEK